MPKTASSEIASKLVGQEVREARKTLGLSQAEVARRLGVTNGYVASVEAGRYNLTIGQLMTIAAALDVNLDVKLSVPEPDEPVDLLPSAR